MNYALASTLAVANALFATVVFAAPAGTLLFAQPGSEIVGSNGVARPAIRGAVLQEGERLRTPVGAISQLLLPDGSLVGMRPGSELKLDLPGNASDRAKQVISLLQGSARVIGSELMDATKPSGFTLQSGLATLRLQGADLESAVVKPDAAKTTGAPDAGSYNRMLIGTGSIGSGTLQEPLAARQVSFVGAINVAAVTVTYFPTTMNPQISTPSTNIQAPLGPINNTLKTIQDLRSLGTFTPTFNNNLIGAGVKIGGSTVAVAGGITGANLLLISGMSGITGSQTQNTLANQNNVLCTIRTKC